MSKYNHKKFCSCCRQQVEKIAKFAGGVCRPCEAHIFAKRSGPGLVFIKPKTCPGAGVEMAAEEVIAMNGIAN